MLHCTLDRFSTHLANPFVVYGRRYSNYCACLLEWPSNEHWKGLILTLCYRFRRCLVVLTTNTVDGETQLFGGESPSKTSFLGNSSKNAERNPSASTFIPLLSLVALTCCTISVIWMNKNLFPHAAMFERTLNLKVQSLQLVFIVRNHFGAI